MGRWARSEKSDTGLQPDLFSTAGYTLPELSDDLKNDPDKLYAFLDSAMGEYANNFSPEILSAIYYAVRSGNDRLRAEATLLVHEGLRRYEDTVLHELCHIHRGHQDYDDFVNDIFLSIYDELPNWDPARGVLTTFLILRFKMSCVKSQASSSRGSSSSRYYENEKVYVNRALAALQGEEGCDNPSVIQIREFIRHHYDKFISEKTIQEILDRKNGSYMVSMDGTNIQTVLASESIDPLYQILSDERAETVRRIIERLEPQHRLIMQHELEMYKSGDYEGKIPDSALIDELKKFIPDVQSGWVKSLRASAERRFIRDYRAEESGERKKSEFLVHRLISDDEIAKAEDEINQTIALYDLDYIFSDEDAAPREPMKDLPILEGAM